MSYSTWEIEGNQVRVTVRVPVIEFQRLGFLFTSPALDGQQPESEAERRIATYLTGHIQLVANNQACNIVLPGVRIVPSNDLTRLTRAWELTCPSSQRLQLRNDAFFVAAPAHLHFARVRIATGSAIEKIFTVHDREWRLFSTETPTEEIESRALDYLWLGIFHILSGADHLVFVLALLLATESIVVVAQIVTGFTLAHSVTLALGVFNLVRPPPATIEAFIGFSIGIVALENFLITTGEETRRWLLRTLMMGLLICLGAAGVGRLHVPFLALLGISIFSVAYLWLLHESAVGQRLRWFVAFIFGLIHGFGFAGALTDMALPVNRIVVALCGFNVGVELGQLGVVMLIWPCLVLMRHVSGSRLQVLTIQTGSAAILAVGIFWFVSRAVGQ